MDTQSQRTQDADAAYAVYLASLANSAGALPFDLSVPQQQALALGAIQRAKALIAAHEIRVLGSYDCARPADPDSDPTEARVCAVTGWTPGVAHKRLQQAGILVRTFPATVEALAQGSIAYEQAALVAKLAGEHHPATRC